MPSRTKTYTLLFMAMGSSVCANVLYFQSRAGTTAAVRDATDPKAMRTASNTEPSRPAAQVSDTVKAIQRELKSLRLYPGQTDGKPSMLLTAAIVAYEQAQALPLTGEPTQALLRELILGPSGELSKPGQIDGVVAGSQAEKLVREVRETLSGLGYKAGGGDGRLTTELVQGIRAFERDNGLAASGRISAALLLHLQRSAAAFKMRAG